MKPGKLIWLASLVLALGGFNGVGTLGTLAAAEQPHITSIDVKDQTLIVTVEMPAGIKKVTLEGRTRLGNGAWTPQAVKRTDGAGGPVMFTLAMSEKLEILRVRGDAENDLPAGFYDGTNSFAGPITSYDLAPPGAGVVTTFDNRADSTTSATTSRDVVESDIWKVDGDTLYFFNTYRGLQVIDIHDANAPVIRGTYRLPAAGEQMYLLADGRVILLAHNTCGWWSADAQSEVLLIDTRGETPSLRASLPVAGSIQESRLVGSALYVASQTYRKITVPPIPGKPDASSGEQWEWGTMVTSFDFSNPESPEARSTEWVGGYGAIVTATDRFFFVANSDPNDYYKSHVRVIDITAPDGTMQAVSTINTAGRIKDKFKLNLNGDTFTAISEYWDAGLVTTNRATRGGMVTKLQTYSLANAAKPLPLGELSLGGGESLFATRFDGDRVYVVTFFRVDPLWVVDLSNPAKPDIHGELEIPGWSTYIQPMGDRLVAVGVETNRVTVSLFDVANPAKPGLLSKVKLGENYSWSEANYDEKAFGFLPDDGLLLIPYSGNTTNNGYAQRVQLIDLGRDALTARGFIEHEVQPRRATLHGDHIFSISGRELLSVDAADRDKPVVKSQTELSWGADRVFVQDNHLITLASEWNNQNIIVLRVASTAEPDRILNEITFTNNLSVAAAAAKDGRFYLALGNSTEIIWTGVLTNGNDRIDQYATNKAGLALTVFDTTHLPSLPVLGGTTVSFDETTYWNGQEVIWPKPGLMVINTSQSFFYGPWYGGVLDAARTVNPAVPINTFTSSTFVDRRFAPWYGQGGQLIAFDVSNAATPKYTSRFSLAGSNYWWSSSRAFTANGLVYVGHQSSEYLPGVLADGQKPPAPEVVKDANGVLVTNQPPYGVWMQRYFLDVVDYADPTTPTLRKPVNVPGLLQGISRNGALIYTVGYHYDPLKFTATGNEWLDASAYDGVEARLVDSIALNDWPHPLVVAGEYVYLGHPGSQASPPVDNSPNLVEVWTVASNGRFIQSPGSVTLDSPAQSMAVFNDLLAVQTYTDVASFDIRQPEAIKLISNGGPQGCFWYYNLNYADGSVVNGLWLPLGPYGVSWLPSNPR